MLIKKFMVVVGEMAGGSPYVLAFGDSGEVNLDLGHS